MEPHTASALDAHYASALGLADPWTIQHINLDTDALTLDIQVVHGAHTAPCPVCKKDMPVIDRREQRSWRHLNMMQFVTTITARVPRTECALHGIKTIEVPWADSRTRFTLLFERFAIEVMHSCTSITKATTLLGISWHQAQHLKERAVARGLVRRTDEPIRYVGTDEKSFLKGHRYASLAYNLDAGCVLEVVEGRTCEAAVLLLNKAILEEQRGYVAAGAMDMWQPFMDAWKDVFGSDTPIVHDKFHVAKYLGTAVDSVRKGEHKTLRKEGSDLLTKTKYLWLKNPDTWDKDEEQRFYDLMKNELKVGRAWALKEAFRKFWEYHREYAAKKFFDRWYFRATHSRLAPMIKVAKTLKRHLSGLIAHVDHAITNAVGEALNSVVQTIKANARGFRNFEHYRIAILFSCGKLDMLP